MDSDNMVIESTLACVDVQVWRFHLGVHVSVRYFEWVCSYQCVPDLARTGFVCWCKSGAGCKYSISAYLLRQSVNSVSTFELWADDHLTASADAREEGWHRSQERTPRSPQRSTRTSSRRWGWDSSWGRLLSPPRRWWPSPRRGATGRWSPRPLSRVSSLSSGEYIRFRAISQTPDEFEEDIRISV